MDPEPLVDPARPSTGSERRRLLSTLTGEQESDDAALLALVRDVGRGSPAAFERFWQKVERRVWMIVRLRVGAALARLMESEDVMQEIALAVWQAAPAFVPAGAGSVYAWVATIVENRVRGLGRAAGAAKRGSGKVRRIESQGGGSLSAF
ncbi:MAG TPA: sigma factor, partial [Planctomycetota bacterium]|nr:sigma factor [Planctomycetota bacterium]